MFRLSKHRQFTRTCHSADGQPFDVTFLILPDDEITALLGEGTEDGVKALLAKVVTGLPEVQDDDDNTLSFEAAKAAFLNTADLRAAMLMAYRVGRIQAATGN